MSMQLNTSIRPEMRQSLVLAPRMIQSMEILQLPLMALQERIDRELIENPTLVDLREGLDEEAETPATPEAGATAEADGPVEDWPGGDDWDWEERRGSRAAGIEEADRKHEAMQNMASRPPTLQDHLADQLSYLDLPERIRAAVDYIINNLDDNGWFVLTLDEVARDAGVTYGEAQRALREVQRLDPPGVAATNLKECLLLQLNDDLPHRETLETLIRKHLEDIQQNRLPVIERKSGIPLDEIKETLDVLRRLNPRPGAPFAAIDNSYVVPDLIVELDEHGRYQVRLEDEYTPQLAISRRYQALLKNRQADPETRKFIQDRIQSARWLIESIEQRRNTLMKVARAIIAHQRDFLDSGPEHIKPLKMQEIADQVGVHVTTVSRAVDDKWVDTPRGVFALKRFFGGGTKTAEGEEIAWETIKQALLEVVSKEDKGNPLSDDDIVGELEKKGLTIARRTVSKYRKALRIPSSRQRKQF